MSTYWSVSVPSTETFCLVLYLFGNLSRKLQSEELVIDKARLYALTGQKNIINKSNLSSKDSSIEHTVPKSKGF